MRFDRKSYTLAILSRSPPPVFKQRDSIRPYPPCPILVSFNCNEYPVAPPDVEPSRHRIGVNVEARSLPSKPKPCETATTSSSLGVIEMIMR
eukprot:scaffold32486_cov160-Skeletonema_menzelii.AAC.1